jgi:replicative superfamily II helicase
LRHPIIQSIIVYLDCTYFIEMLKFGIGCYHAGMSIRERSVTEKLFRIGCLNILIATSTLGIDTHISLY